MKTANKLKVGAGTTIIAALLTGFLTNGATQVTSQEPAAKDQERIPQAVAAEPISSTKMPTFSPMYEAGLNIVAFEKIPAR